MRMRHGELGRDLPVLCARVDMMRSAKEILLTNCERDFVLEAVDKNQRIDGRKTYDYRNIHITFGVDRGCCQVKLGKTRVLAQVSAEITCPKPARPVEGLFYLNLELSPMAAPNFEAGRLSSYGVELNRLLERCLQDSRCLDLDSLCIVAGEKVWCIRVDVHVLNHDGNIIDCATIAAVTALSHFKRPDVTVTADGVTVHPVEEREPVPLGIYHTPLSITFAFFSEGNHLLLDPTELEERVMDGKMVLGMNVYREMCTLHLGGKMFLLKDQVLRCTEIASKRVADVTAIIKKALSEDAEKRLSGDPESFGCSISTDQLLRNKLNSLNLTLEPKELVPQTKEVVVIDDDMEQEIIEIGPGTVKSFESEWAKWDIPDDPQIKNPKRKRQPTQPEIKEIDSDSSDEVTILQPESVS